MQMTLYARYEPTNDESTLRDAQSIPKLRKKKDLVLYYDAACTEIAGCYPWHYQKPRRGQKTVMHNCARYALEWVV